MGSCKEGWERDRPTYVFNKITHGQSAFLKYQLLFPCIPWLHRIDPQLIIKWHKLGAWSPQPCLLIPVLCCLVLLILLNCCLLETILDSLATLQEIVLWSPLPKSIYHITKNNYCYYLY